MAQADERIFTTNFIYASLATLLFFVAFVLFFPTLPIFIEEQGGNASLIGLLVGGSSLVSLSLRPFTGRLVDSLGRKRFLTLGALFMAASSFSYDFVTSTAGLWPVRLMAGAGVSFYFTASMAYVGDIAPASKRGQAMSYFGMFNNVALALGPAVGTWIISNGSLRGLEGRLERWLPGSGSEVSEDFNFALLFVTATLLAFLAVLMTRKVQEVYVPEARQSRGLRETFQNMFSKPAVFPAVLNFLLIVNFVSLNIFIPIYNKRELGVDNIGLYYTVFAIAIIVSRLWGGPLLDRFPRAYSIIPSMGIMMVGTILLGLVGTAWMVFLSAAIVGTGSGVAQPGLQAMVVDRCKGVNLGAASSTFAIGLDIGLFGGGALMGQVLDLTNFTTFFIVAGSFSGASMLLLAAATLRERRPAVAQAPAAARG